MATIVLIEKDPADISTLNQIINSSDTLKDAIVFSDEWDALAYLIESDGINGVIVDVDLASCDELRLVKVLEALNLDLGFVFVSKSGRYGVEAFNYNVANYFTKPYTQEKLTESIFKLRDQKLQNQEKKIYIKTFGSFEIMVDGKLVPWSNSKPKEILAFLVDARGASVSSQKIQRTLWPDSDMKKSASTFHTTLHQLRKFLIDLELDELIESRRGSHRINTEIFECDFYEFENLVQTGTKPSLTRAFELYQGNYLENNCYGWSNFNRLRLRTKFDEISNVI